MTQLSGLVCIQPNSQRAICQADAKITFDFLFCEETNGSLNIEMEDIFYSVLYLHGSAIDDLIF